MPGYDKTERDLGLGPRGFAGQLVELGKGLEGIPLTPAGWAQYLIENLGGAVRVYDPSSYSTNDSAKEESKGLHPRLEGVASNISPGRQGKHIPGHNNSLPGRSPLNDNIDPQNLLNGLLSGKFTVVGFGSRGDPVFDFGRTIGVDNESGLPTRFGTIHPGKDGSHIVPANPTKIRGK